MRPTFRNAPAPAIPTTMVEKTSGAMIDLIRLRKMSRRKKTAFPQSGRNQPTVAPTIKPIMICTVSDGQYHGRCSRFSEEGLISSADFADFRRLRNQETTNLCKTAKSAENNSVHVSDPSRMHV